MEREFFVIAFESTHYAIMVEKKLKEKFKIDMIPTPREITASCGLSIMFNGDLLEEVMNELENNEIPSTQMGIYRIKKNGTAKIAERIN